MRFSLRTLSVGLFAVGVMILTQRTESYADAPVKFTPSQIAFYEKDVLPILKANCYQCHGNGKLKGGLDLRRRDSILTGGDLGPAAKLDKPLESHIIQAINYTEGLEMPPKGKLPPEQIVILTKWVKDGLPFPEQKIEPKVEAPKHKGGVVTAESRNYWAYKKVVRPDAPKVKDTSWVKNPIDAFILSKLEEKGLKPAPEADKLTLVRRIYFDLTGLPPTPEQIDAFMKDSSPKALEALIDRLLESKEYGEKWGRHWLDVVRYSESEGFEYDRHRPGAWRYRDYVVDSFNRDKSYDRFVVEQLAGDEALSPSDELLVAAGFNRLGPVRRNAGNQELAFSRNEVLTEMADAAGTVFLGLTVACARCHDHKFDGISLDDYYCFQSFWGTTQEQDVVKANAAEQAAWKAKSDKIQGEIKKLQKPETRGMRKDWYTGVEGLMTVVRVLPVELYEKVVSGKGDISDGASVPGAKPAGKSEHDGHKMPDGKVMPKMPDEKK